MMPNSKSPTDNVVVDAASASWPEPTPVLADRVLTGTPATSTIALDHQDHCKFGLWRATSGAFTTDHSGYTEFIHIVEGTGRLISDSDVVTELYPGRSVVVPSGWRGRWEIDRALVKTYSVIPDIAPNMRAH